MGQNNFLSQAILIESNGTILIGAPDTDSLIIGIMRDISYFIRYSVIV